MKEQLLLNTFHIIIDGLFGSVPILLSFMILSFGAEEKDAGLIMSLASLIITLAGLSTAFFSRHFGLFQTTAIIMLLYGIGFFTNAFSQNIYLSGFFFILSTAGFSVFHNTAFSYLTVNSGKHSLGKAIGNFTALGDIGRIPLTSLSAFIAALPVLGFPGWRAICLLYGLSAFAGAAYLLVSSRRSPKAILTEGLPASKKKAYFPAFLLRERQYALPILAAILDAIGSNQVFVFLPFLLFAKGIDPKILGSFAFAFTFGCLLGKAALGRLVDQFGNRKIFMISEILMSLLLILLIVSHHLFLIVGASFLLGIVTKGTVPVIQTIITEPAQERHEYDNIFSLNSFACGIANILSPLLLGFIASALGIHWSFALMAFAAICAVLPILVMKKQGEPLDG